VSCAPRETSFKRFFYGITKADHMKSKLLEMLANMVGSRKASFVVATAALNLVVFLFMRFGIQLDEATQKSIQEAVANVTEVVMVYIAAQGGIDLVKQLKAPQDTGEK